MRKKGFTLIELMIVVAIIAIIAAIAIPGLLRARISANESSCIGSLRSISTSEVQFQQARLVDQDSDGTGEFGFFSELTGMCPLRPGANAGQKVSPPFLPSALQPRGTTLLSNKSGYNFRMYLAGLPAESTATATAPGSTTVQIAIDAQELKFRTYAWPVNTKNSGVRCFVIDHVAEVLAAANLTTTAATPVYTDTVVAPFSAAVVTFVAGADTTSLGGAFFGGSKATDNQTWLPAGN